MQGKVHVAIGMGSLALLCVQHPAGFDLGPMRILPEIGLVSATLGSYMPDIDMQTTHAGQQHKIASKVVSKVGGGHRGITHTLLIPLIVLVLMLFVSSFLADFRYLNLIASSVLFGFEYGYVMHLFADMFNGKGIPLLWPISPSKIHIMDLPSSGFVPWLFTAVILGIQALFVFGGLFS